MDNMKSVYFYTRQKRCLVTLTDSSITIHPDSTPNLQTVIKLSDVLDAKLCTCSKPPNKLLCSCAQLDHEEQQLRFHNRTLTRRLIDGESDSGEQLNEQDEEEEDEEEDDENEEKEEENDEVKEEQNKMKDNDDSFDCGDDDDDHETMEDKLIVNTEEDRLPRQQNKEKSSSSSSFSFANGKKRAVVETTKSNCDHNSSSLPVESNKRSNCLNKSQIIEEEEGEEEEEEEEEEDKNQEYWQEEKKKKEKKMKTKRRQDNEDVDKTIQSERLDNEVSSLNAFRARNHHHHHETFRSNSSSTIKTIQTNDEAKKQIDSNAIRNANRQKTARKQFEKRFARKNVFKTDFDKDNCFNNNNDDDESDNDDGDDDDESDDDDDDADQVKRNANKLNRSKLNQNRKQKPSAVDETKENRIKEQKEEDDDENEEEEDEGEDEGENAQNGDDDDFSEEIENHVGSLEKEEENEYDVSSLAAILAENSIEFGCVRLFYSVEEGAFARKVKWINLIPEVIAPEQSANGISIQMSDLNRLNKQISDFVVGIQQKLKEFDRPKTLLLFINPVGGKRRAPIIYRKLCQPLFSLAGVCTHAIFTQNANHAYRLLRNQSVDLSMYHAIGCVGGDGMFSEILNGILKRQYKSTKGKLSPSTWTNETKSNEPISLSTNRLTRRTSVDFQSAAPFNFSSNSSTLLAAAQTSNMKKARPKLLPLPEHARLESRQSLPSPPNTAPVMLSNFRSGKRHSLPTSPQFVPFNKSPVSPSNSFSSSPGNALPPLLLVPAGSTDAVAYATNAINDPLTVLVNFLLGKQIKIDVAAVHSLADNDRLLKYCCSFLGYGYFGDILRDSEENLRWMGPKRYDWAGLKKFLLHRVYKGELRLKVSRDAGNPLDSSVCLNNCQLCSQSYIRSLFERNEPSALKGKSWPSKAKQDSNNNNPNQSDLEQNRSSACDASESGDGLTITNCSSPHDPSGDNRVSIKGRFLAINAATMSCRCGHSKYGISPAQHLGNGCTDLIVVGQCTRKDYLKYLLRTGFSEKSAFDLDFVNVYRVKEFEFRPSIDSEQTPSVWNCDGEILREAAIRVKIHCQLISIFGTGLELRPKNRNLIRREKVAQSMTDLQQINKSNGKRKSNGRLSKDFSSNPIGDTLLTFANDKNNNLRRSSSEILPKIDSAFLAATSIRT